MRMTTSWPVWVSVVLTLAPGSQAAANDQTADRPAMVLEVRGLT
jgi:hypothetical protein